MPNRQYILPVTSSTGSGGGGVVAPPAPAWVVPIQIFTMQSVITGGLYPPSGPGADVVSYFLFYLPFPFTFTKLGYRVDGAVIGSTLIEGMYTSLGNLVWDTGLQTSGATGSYVVTSFWNGSTTVSSISLPQGLYYWAWGGEGDPSALVNAPGLNIGDFFTSDTMINIDGTKRWGHETTPRISGGHLPATLNGTYSNGSLTAPINAILFA